MTSNTTNFPTIAFIGAGRIARGLAVAFERAGARVIATASRSKASAQSLAEQLPHCRALPIDEAAAAAQWIFLTVPDAEIEKAASAVTWRAEQSVMHCSGATGLAALATAREAGAGIGGFHPMQTFTDPAVALATLPGCTVAIEADASLFDPLCALAQAIGCRPFALPAGARSRYHASGSYAAQFLNALLLEAGTVWQSFGMDRDSAVRALLPLMKGTLAAIESGGLAQGLAGPVSRGDAGTIRRQLEGVAQVGAHHLTLFRELTRRTLPLAIERGTLRADQIDALRALLENTD